jgi:hypothetical protein
VTLAGSLADGSTAFTYSAPMSKTFAWPLAVIVKASASVPASTLAGMIQFDTDEDHSDLGAIDIDWFRTAFASAQHYASGWPAGIKVDAVGALYSSSTTVQNSLGLPAPNVSGSNAKLMITDGGLSPDITKTNFKIVNSTVTKNPTTDPSYTLVVTQSSGGFNGTFAPNWASPNATKPTFKGVILQKGGSKGGYGFFLNNATSGPDRQAGGVTLSAP